MADDLGLVGTDVADLGTDFGGGSDSAADTGAPAADGEGVTPAADIPADASDGPGDGEQPPADANAPLIQNGSLAPAAKAALEALKATDAALAKKITRALFAEDRLRRELPGGFKEIETLRNTIEQLGGDEGIQELNTELNGWREFDQLYTASDPKVLDFLMQTPEAQTSFLKIAPAVFDRFREASPEGYSAYVSQVFLSDMVAEGLPLALERLQDFIPADNPKAQQVLKQVVDYVNRINGFAKQQVSKPGAAAAPQGGDKKAQELQQREQQLTRTEWRGEADQRHRTLFRSAWKAQIGDRKLSDTQAATVKELYGLKLQAIVKASPDFNQKLDRYFTSGQKDGFLRYLESVYKDAVPRALRSAIGQAVPGKPGPKPGAPASASAAASAKPAVAAAGFQMVNTKPDMATVDRIQTSPDMWMNGKAVLRDGKKIQWSR